MKKVFLIGLANAGKSTIFNKLTGSQVHTGNWLGVTVSASSAIFTANNQKYEVYDLPGVYGLTPYSNEESVTVREVLNHQDDIFVAVIDCNNFERSLNLTLQLLELGLNIVVGLNFIEDSTKRGVEIDAAALSRKLGVNVAILPKNTQKLKKNIAKLILSAHRAATPIYVEKWKIDEAKDRISAYCDSKFALYNAIRLREGAVDELWACEIPLNIQPKLRNFALADGVKIIAQSRFENIKKITEKCEKNRAKMPYGVSKLDKIILNKYAAIPIFFAVMLGIFYITFGFFGDFLSEIASFLVVDWLGGGLLKLLELLSAPLWLLDFFRQAIIGGIGSIFSFLPQVILLFLFLEILEQSGYISRLAWLFDGVLGKLGLSGRSIFSLLMGFGCSTTAIPTARTLRNKRARIKTILLVPFMSCSAKLPVFGVLAGAFWGNLSVLIVFSLYLLGIALAISIALIVEKIFPTTQNLEILEFTPLRVPSATKLCGIVGRNVWQFLSRIWTVLLACTIIIWLCNNFTITLEYISSPSEKTSILESISQLLAPIFAPLGFGWGAVCALLFGLVAKELVLSGIAVLNGVTDGNIVSGLLSGGVVTLTSASCLAFLVFCLLYSPCISALIQIRQNVSRKVFISYLVLQFILAYVCALVAFGIGSLVEILGFNEFAWLAITVIAVIIVIEFTLLATLNKKDCASCSRCTICHK